MLVIYAHPNPESFNGAILQQVVQGLKDAGHVYQVIDLYKDGFNPVLVLNHKFRRRDMKDNPETAPYRKAIQDANHLIFIYPVWWSGTPAILKGFFDRVLASGFAYTYNGRVPKGLLKGKSAWVFYTIDSPRWYVKVFRRSAEWTVVRDATLKFCGIRKVKRFVFYQVRNSSESRRKQWLDVVYQKVGNLK